MELSSPHEYFKTTYCRLIGFFTLDASVQSELLPAQVAPFYASFNEGDGYFTQPLNVIFCTLRDVAIHVMIHRGEWEYSFVSETLNDALLEAMHAIYTSQWSLDNCFDTASLDDSHWSALRAVARQVRGSLAESNRLPFGDWHDFTG